MSHPDARIGGKELYRSDFESGVDIELHRFATGDNPLYVFQDPGTPEINDSTAYCSHCHVTINEDWVDSIHRQSASNPVVQDVYAGTAAAASDAASCAERGGTWATGIGPGTPPAERRTLSGTLPDLNPTCGLESAMASRRRREPARTATHPVSTGNWEGGPAGGNRSVS